MKKYALQLMSLLMVGALLVGCTAATGDGAQTTVTTSAPTTTTTTVTTTAVAPTTTTENTTVTTEGTTTTTESTTVTTKTTTTTTPQPRVKNLMATVSATTANAKTVDDTFYNAYTQFSLNFFKSAYAKDGKNTLVSPLSVETVLAMIANGANGTTKQEIEKALGLSVADLNGYLCDYMRGLPNRSTAFAKLANSIWFNSNFSIKKPFLQTNANYYDAQLYQSKFDGKTASDINEWVSENTDGMINNIVDNVSSADAMVLVNTILFNAKWKTRYSSTWESTFTTESGVARTVEFLTRTENMVYIDTEYERGFAKEYDGGYYSFVALLPTEGTSMDDYVNNLTTQRVRSFWGAGSMTVKTHIPKFTIEYEADMDSALDALGIRAMTNPATADLSGISSGELYVSEMRHKAKIEVDENGTKAAAATSATIKTGASIPMTPPPVVTLDRPFVYMIMDNTTGLPLFIGSVTDIGK